jgi:hypothetical protein
VATSLWKQPQGFQIRCSYHVVEPAADELRLLTPHLLELFLLVALPFEFLVAEEYAHGSAPCPELIYPIRYQIVNIKTIMIYVMG